MKRATIQYSALIAIGAAIVFFAHSVLATTSTATFSVGLTIPATSTSGGGGGGGSNPPAAVNPPVISNIATSPATTTALVSWSATAAGGLQTISFTYGTSTEYGQGSAVVGNFQTGLTGLVPNTQYFFKIIATDYGSQVSSSTGSFTTLDDNAPPQISAVTATANTTDATVTWLTDKAADSQVRYGTTVLYGQTVSLGSLVTNHNVQIFSLVPSTTYHYQVVSTDSKGNSAASGDNVFTTAPSAVPPPDVSNLQLTVGVSSMQLTWVNPTVPDFAGVVVVRTTGSAVTSTESGVVVYTGSGTSVNDTTVQPDIRYYFTVFSFNTSNLFSGGTYKSGIIVTPLPAEVCNNTVDDDGNGLVDCADPACSSYPACLMVPTSTPTTTTPPFPITPGGTSSTPPYVPPVITVPGFLRLSFSDLQFLAGNRLITLTPNNNAVSSLPGTSFSVLLPANHLAATTTSLVIKIDGTDIHQFALASDRQNYITDFSFPTVGTHQFSVEVIYSSGEQDHVTGYLIGSPFGVVSSAGMPLTGAQIALYSEGGGLFDVAKYGEANPQYTNNQGQYGWVVPNGRYLIQGTLSGYQNRVTPAFSLVTNIINGQLDLVADLKLDKINLDTVVENTKVLTEMSLQKLSDTADKLQEIKADPNVQKNVSTFVAPTVVGAVAVGTISLVSLTNLLSLLQLLFVQPLLLLGRKKIVGYGQVYNSLNKLPIDLATVRLINAETGQLVQSKVTDSKGRYGFMVEPGKYKLQVFKNNFVFPSVNLEKVVDDGQKSNIYHGEEVPVTDEDAIIARHIPIDPLGSKEKPVKIFWQQFARRLKIGLSVVGLTTTALSLYIAPRWYMWVLLGVHILLFVAFYRLSIPAKIKSWGTVFDNLSKEPIGRVVARLFNAQFNKLVNTQITDGRGRYYFLAGDNEYFVTYEHPQYQSEKTNLINLKGKEAENIAINIALKKK